eukprot:jgi/Astpho2/9790/Aster-03763
MSFFQRVFGYIFNEVLVNSLANSRTFQRFAIRSTHMIEELTKKGVDKQGQIGDKAAEFSKTFREELRKGMETLDRQQQGPKKGG